MYVHVDRPTDKDIIFWQMSLLHVVNIPTCRQADKCILVLDDRTCRYASTDRLQIDSRLANRPTGRQAVQPMSPSNGSVEQSACQAVSLSTCRPDGMSTCRPDDNLSQSHTGLRRRAME